MATLTRNNCDGCTACCLIEAVHELGKPSYSRCEHLCAGGCGIYNERPESCRDYTCCYLAGLLGKETKWRPDNCGLLISLTPVIEQRTYDLWVYETRPDARDDARINYLVTKIGNKMGARCRAILFHPYGCKIGAAFKVDATKYPENADVEGKKNQFRFVADGFGVCGDLI